MAILRGLIWSWSNCHPIKLTLIPCAHKFNEEGAAIEYERKTQAKNFELSEAMEKHVASLSREVQNLRSKLADAEKAMAAATAAVTSANPDFGYGNLENGYAGNSLPGPYAVQQDSVDRSFQYGLGTRAHGPLGPYVMQGHQIHN